MATDAPDLPIKLFRDLAAWEKWLAAHPDSSGLWLRIAKKDTGLISVSYVEAIEVALCHGWIDGQRRSFDEQSFLQRFTPRRPRSLWSKINVGKAEALIIAGRMREGGLREIELARADGRWATAYAGAATMEVHPELVTALAKNRKAAAFFETLDRTNRFAVCLRVQTAVKAQTRASRIEKLVAMLARGEKIHGK